MSEALKSQVKQLKQTCPDLKEKGRNQYEVTLVFGSGVRCALLIDLASFPNQPPVLQLVPSGAHAFLSPLGFVEVHAHDGLRNWNASSTSIGKIVGDVVQSLLRSPPNFGGNSSATPQSSSSSSSTNTNTLSNFTFNPVSVTNTLHINSQGPVSTNPYAPANSQINLLFPTPIPAPAPTRPLDPVMVPTPFTNVNSSAIANGNGNANGNASHQPIDLGSNLPPVPMSFPELDGLSTERLRQLLEDDKALSDFAEELPYTRQLVEAASNLRELCTEMANANLEKQKETEILEAQVLEKQQRLMQLKTDMDRLLEKKNQLKQQFSATNIIEMLEKSMHALEQETDQLTQRFLSNEISERDFLNQYIPMRRLYHLRKIKKQSLEQNQAKSR